MHRQVLSFALNCRTSSHPEWMKTTLPLPQAISALGGFFLLGLVVLMFLPETKGHDLPG